MTGLHLKYLLTYLNSRLCEWYFDKIAATSGVGTRRWIKIYIDQICVPFPSQEAESKMDTLAEKALANPNEGICKEIDYLFYEMFDLEPEEVEFIEKSIL